MDPYMTSKAYSDLSEIIKYPIDLHNKIEKISVDVKDIYYYQENCLSDKILKYHSILQDVEKDIARIEKMYASFLSNKNKTLKILNDFLVLINNYQTIKSICLVHSNLLRVKYFTEKLNTLHDPVANEDIEIYHSKIFELEDFMYDLEYYVGDIDREDHIEVSRSISHIKKEILEFNCKLLEIGENFIENEELKDKVERILEKEQKRDELTIMCKKGEKGEDPISNEIYKLYKKFTLRQCKNTKERYINAIRGSIKNKFNKLKSDEYFIQKLDFVNKDLRIIQDKMCSSFFSFDEYLVEYHCNLKELLNEKTKKLDAGEILAIVEFVDEYYNNVETVYKRIPDALGPRLLDNSDDLLEEYTLTAEAKLKEWISNITKIEVSKFYIRNEEISRDEEDKLISTGFVSLLQIVKMQLEPISFNKKIFSRITSTIIRYCNLFKDELEAAMEKDFKQSVQMKNKAGYEDFCIMFGNSGLKLTQYITSLPQCKSPEVRELGNTFMSILKSANYYLSNFVLDTCNPVVSELFTEKWYNDDILKIFILTLKDFLEDYKNTMSDYVFITFIHELATSISCSYLKQLETKRALILETCGTRLKGDYIRIKHTLEEYGDKTDVLSSLSPITKIIPIIESRSVELFLEEVKSLKYDYPDLRKKFVKSVITKRTDLSTEEKKQFTNRLRECFDEAITSEKTVFSKVFGL